MVPTKLNITHGPTWARKGYTMKYSSIQIKDLVTWDQCYKALVALEDDSSNYYHGQKRFNGHACAPMATARKKLKAIQNKMARIIIRDHAIKVATVGKCFLDERCHICNP